MSCAPEGAARGATGSSMDAKDAAPLLAGPVLRRVQVRNIALWLATTSAQRIHLTVYSAEGAPLASRTQQRSFCAGERLHLHLVEVVLDVDLQVGAWTAYRLWLAEPGSADPSEVAATAEPAWTDTTDPALCYPGQQSPGFVFAPQVQALLHGSCRKPHQAAGGDGLVRADAHLQRLLQRRQQPLSQRPLAEPDSGPWPWPSALVLSGDQVYCDDVAGPMLRAIHQLSARLGLPDEALSGFASGIRSSADLLAHPGTYYRRMELLPKTESSRALVELVFGGVRKPVFTTVNAHNHLITLAEVLAMYLLVWSPVPWEGLDLSPPPGLSDRHLRRWARERAALDEFVPGLPAVRRLLAHLPVAMIFDDHDVTDDWNLSREWEQAAYGHPLSRRMIGNALIGYLLNQGWGNRPEAFDDSLLDAVQAAMDAPGGAAHDALVERLLQWRDWHYTWDTTPPLMVVDSRTHRWRSEVSARRPSGLLDWEGLTDLQQALRGHPAVLLVVSAPVFGVKLIETVQRVFTFIGLPLMVDAENWMSHPGAASAILNIFRHPHTPQNFVILSGDVHYAFVYDVELRARALRGQADPAASGPHVWQVCSSALRNRFPPRLLAVLDHLNRWLYSPRSPLNRFTRRRLMRVTPRKPEGTPHGRRLLEGSGVGLLTLDEEGRPLHMLQLLADGRDVAFVRRDGEARED